MTRIALIGMGKMGRAIESLASSRECEIVSTIDPHIGAAVSVSVESLNGADVAIEFTSPESAAANVRACLAARCPVVVGTTGWYDELPAMRAEVAAMQGALLTAANFSIGVAIFERILASAAASFAATPAFAPHMVETHHAQKLDAPSGTAKMLLRTLTDSGLRDVPVTSIRVGSVPGTHELIFDGPFEQVRLEHMVRDRRVFADGALTAAKWLVGKTGVFTMTDVLSPAEEGAR